MTDEITLWKTYTEIHDILGFDGKAIGAAESGKIWKATRQFCGEVASNVIRHRVIGNSIVEVLQFGADDFMARYKTLDFQLRELVVVDFVRGSQEVVRSAYVDFQGVASEVV